MAELLVLLAAITAAVLAAVAWLASLAGGFTCPGWCETTAVLIACLLLLLRGGAAWRTRA